MKLKLVLVLLICSTSAATAFNFSSIPIPNIPAFFCPNKIGNFTWISFKSVVQELAQLTANNDTIKYYLYTKANPKDGQLLEIDNPDLLALSNFDSSRPTRILIHGFQSDHNQTTCTDLRDAFLETGDCNVICVGWDSIAKKSYPTARYSVSYVGEDVSKLCKFLNSKSHMSFDDLLVAGHSLGAHVAGFTAKNLKNITVIPLVIGFDPAQPLFSYVDCATRLCKSDAKYVQTIQTCGDRLGFMRPIGEGAFYPNGGRVQPGCGLDPFGTCAHSRSYIYYGEAIRLDDFTSRKCPNSAAAGVGACQLGNSGIRMGSPSSYGASGIFYVPVNGKSPYGKGR